ncbi:MAG: phage holin family protein [Clostridia bacterium]
MDLIWNKIQIACAVLGGWLGWYLGGADGLLITLLVFVILDYVTGVMCAVIDKALSSEIGFKGLFRKVLIFALVGIGHVVDTQVIGQGSTLRSAIICFYLSNEGLSMLENAAHLGLPVPDKLKDVLAQLHDRGSKANKEGDE